MCEINPNLDIEPMPAPHQHPLNATAPGRRFALETDERTGEIHLVGPADYMRDQGKALLEQILAGDDSIFNLTASQSPDLYQAVLVRLQTDYAGWRGLQQVLSWLE